MTHQYTPIRDYAVIGDCHGCALVGHDTSLDRLLRVVPATANSRQGAPTHGQQVSAIDQKLLLTAGQLSGISVSRSPA